MTEYGRCPAFGYECEYVSMVEAQAAEIKRLRDDRGKLRELIAKLYCASGCSCCRDDEAWEAAANALGEMLDAPEWDDKSLGRNWYAVRDEYAALAGKAEQ